MATTRALTPSRTTPFATTSIAPDTPTSLTSLPTATDTLAPITAAASTFRTSTSPTSIKALSPQTSPQPLTGAAALEEHKRLREQQERAAGAQTSPNPNAAAISNLLGQPQSPARGTSAKASEQIAQMAQKIEIPEPSQHDTLQTSPVSMSSMGSLDLTTAANATTAPILAPSMPTQAENPFPSEDPNAPRPAVDAGVPTDQRAFTFPPPPSEDPRFQLTPQRGLSMPTAGLNSPRSTAAKRHKCPYCATVFTRHHNLKSHLLTHSQEKPYECQQCKSRFRRLHDLKRHTKLHTGERPHECPKCGRKFARGDALARHNKGQGGCAGRRSSLGMDPEDADGKSGEHMEGIQYTAEPEHMDDSEDPESRRVSMSGSSRPRQDSSAYRAGPSTYPPPALGAPLPRTSIAPMYPPSASTSTRDNSSPQTHISSLSSLGHFPPPGPPGAAVFQAGVTESPKPISPGHPNSQRGSGSGPSGPSSYAFSGRGSGPQLPPLTQAMPMTHSTMPPPTAGSQPGSLSSTHSGSGASGREILGAREGDWWSHMREMETRMSKMQEDHQATVARIQSEHSRLEADLRTKVAQLEAENRTLRGSQDTEVRRLQDELSELKGQLGDAVRA